MPKINLHNLVMSPVARMILFFLFLIAIVAIFFAVHNRKEEIRDKAAVLHQAKEYTYEAPIQEYREQQKPKTLKMIEMTPENKSEKQAESPGIPQDGFCPSGTARSTAWKFRSKEYCATTGNTARLHSAAKGFKTRDTADQSLYKDRSSINSCAG